MKKPKSQSEANSAALIKTSPKRLFETLMEQTADRIYIKDEKGRFVSASYALAEMHNYTDRHDVEGLTDFDLFSQEHAQQAYDDEQKILETGEPMINKVEKETWPDGSITWVSSSKAPLYLQDDTLVGIIGISRDITAEKKAQEQLAEREKRLREQNEIMRADYESAKKVQSIMIPGRVPKIKNIAIAYKWKPMTSVGGDILTFPRNPKNKLLFFLGDVCGHGVSAAFYTILLKYFCHQAAENYENDPKAFLKHLNEEVKERIKEGFITGLAGHFSHTKQDGSRTLHISNAGHRKILIHRKHQNEIEEVQLPPGIVLGLPGSQASENREITLHIGDRFYAFTDGIAEASDPDGNEFGNPAVIEHLEKTRSLPIQESIESLYDAVAKYTQSPTQQDDITLLGFELN
jgi:PAS domain S-box-containing protein